jgi:hypothetical protein
VGPAGEFLGETDGGLRPRIVGGDQTAARIGAQRRGRQHEGAAEPQHPEPQHPKPQRIGGHGGASSPGWAGPARLDRNGVSD